MDDTLKSSCGKMCQEHLVPTEEKISASSSKNSAKLKEVTPLFLDLREKETNGETQDLSWEMGFQSLGESSMLNFGAYPNGVEESFLWQILEDNVPDKYSLSPKACRGILARSERRGKVLDPLLREALIEQSMTPEETGGLISPTLIGDHENRITDYTAIVVECFRKTGHPRNAQEGQGWEMTDKADTLNVFDSNEQRTPTLIVEAADMYNAELTGDKTMTLTGGGMPTMSPV